MQENFSLFRRQWACLHRNLSGKYRVMELTVSATDFIELRSKSDVNLPNGLYVSLDGLRRVSLISIDADSQEVFIANGNYRDGRYETLNYVTDETRDVVDEEFQYSPGRLPTSLTSGKGVLEPLGNCFSNLPDEQADYVSRERLENELSEQLLLMRHEIIALTGAGGIGKTSLTLRALRRVAEQSQRFEAMVWFSARDIDLIERGPRIVRPEGLTEADFAATLVSLLQAEVDGAPIDFLRQCFEDGAIGATLFVFDNFETVSNPGEIFKTIDAHIRAPNKVLITTRMRDFKGDFPMRVMGMDENEGRELIDITAKKLDIQSLITKSYVDQLLDESDGHPYVMKIMLGEVAKIGSVVKPERIVAAQDEILDALFERSYASLTPVAQRVFLLLSSWRSIVPELAVEVVLLRSENERMEVSRALEELKQYSFVEELPITTGGEIFLGVPLAAMLFGMKKLKASPLRAAVDADRTMLMWFGPTNRSEIRKGVEPAIERLIRGIAKKVSDGEQHLDSYSKMVEFIARRVPSTWLLLADLYVEQGGDENIRQAKECLRRYLEAPTGARSTVEVWEKLADLASITEDPSGEVHALAEMCETPDVRTDVLSTAANRINFIYKKLNQQGRSELFQTEEKRLLLRRVSSALDQRKNQLDATGCSRLAWLHLSLGNKERALDLAALGCRIDPNNEHCRQLEIKLADW